MDPELRLRLRSFNLLLFGQLVSLLGTGLTSFALSVYVFQQMGSVSRFSLVVLASLVPGLLIAPTAGVLVDRLDRRKVLLVTNLLAALVTAVLALLFAVQGTLPMWQILSAVVASSLIASFQRPAILASVPLLVPKEMLGKANGALQMLEVVPQVAAPLLAGFLVATFSLLPVLLVDVASYVFALGTLFLLRLPRPAASPAGAAKPGGPAAGGVGEAWRFVAERRGLMSLLVLAAVVSFCLAMVQVTLQPLVLTMTDAKALGLVMTLGNAGLLLGSLLISVSGGPKRVVAGLLAFSALFGVGLIVAGLRPSLITIIGGFVLSTFAVPFTRGAMGVLWQTKAPLEMQGRLASLRQMVASGVMPLGFVLAGPVVDRWLNPALADSEAALASTVGTLVGVGPGRGIGLLLVALGAFTVLAALAGWMFGPLRHLEAELADQVPSRAVGGAG